MASPIKPSDIASTIPSSTGSICEKLAALFSLASKMSTFWTWAFDSDGAASSDFKNEFRTIGCPAGSMVAWPTDAIPTGWLAANGQIVSRATYADLFAAIGVKYGSGDGSTTFKLPDLQFRTIFGANGSHPVGESGGSADVTLTMANLPSEPAPIGDKADAILVRQTDSVTDDTTPEFGAITAHTIRTRKNGHSDHAENALGDLGDDEPFEIIPPYFAAVWIIKT